MRIAIMGAMEEEVLYLREYFQDRIRKETNGKKEYFLVKYDENIELVITNSGIGKVFSTIVATTLINHFECDMLLFTGVAGGLKKGLKIGDIIIAESLCQHDLDITAFGHKPGYVPGLEIFTKCTKELKILATEVANKNEIKVSKGIIATGDQFIANKEKKDFVIDTFNAEAIEMEGASVAATCNFYSTPFLIIRTISDTADEEANVNFKEFLEKSAKISSDFIIKIIEEKAKKQRILKNL